MLESVKYQSNNIPEDFAVRYLGGELYEIVSNENVVSSNTTSVDGHEQTIYHSDMVILREKIRNRSEAIVAFIRIKYSSNDETALINRGIADKFDLEYVSYRNYVDWCKEQASVYFGSMQSLG